MRKCINLNNQHIAELYQNGQSLREIATLYKTDSNTIKQHLLKHGVKIRSYQEALQLRYIKYGVPRHRKSCIFNKGYILRRLDPSHPYYAMANSRGYVYEHRLVMAQKLGRCLSRQEIVHHINGVRTDNRVENLELLSPNKHGFTELLCQHCELKKEVRLLRWTIKELRKELQSRLEFK